MKEFEYKKNPITIDYKNMMIPNNNSNNAIHPLELEEYSETFRKISLVIDKRVKSGQIGFMKTPFNEIMVEEIERIVESKKPIMDNLLVLGIGGSALGNITIHDALNEQFHNLKCKKSGLPRIFIEDNIDPDRIHSLLSLLDLKKTVVNVITKSGTTPETMSTFFILKDLLKKQIGSDYKKHIVAITDPDKGVLRKMADEEGFDSLPIPPELGGRFSVLSPVGLFSASASGINIKELLQGSRDMDSQCKNPELLDNPAFLISALKYIQYRRGIKINVMMPYSSALKSFADWYCQLIGESLGKKYDLDGKICNSGITPISALGTTDQHSQLQLYIEGPEDKLVIFLFLKDYKEKIPIPDDNLPVELSYFKGVTLNDLFKAEGKGTAASLTECGRLNFAITIDELSPYILGQLFYLFEMVTMVLGMLMNINPFDQPGVDRGKVLTKEFLKENRFVY
ncbi:glucose-6-phosphate isomerase [bacterium]|nr:glucose-6-phosphate isomerase [bacterium]